MITLMSKAIFLELCCMHNESEKNNHGEHSLYWNSDDGADRYKLIPACIEIHVDFENDLEINSISVWNMFAFTWHKLSRAG